MDKARFSNKSPGELVSIVGPKPDWAFVPEKLDRKRQVDFALVALLVEARDALARLDGAGRYIPSNTMLLRPLQRREAVHSSALEGTFATAEELLAYGLEPKDPVSSTDPSNAWREVFNYDAALQLGQKLLVDLPLSSRVIRQLHKTLLDGVRGTDRTPGDFRKRQVHIGSDMRFIPPPPEKIEDLIADLENYMNEELILDPLLRSFVVHYQFETIHPFLDGNGRVGRLLLSLMIFKQCRLQVPWLYLSPFFEQHKEEYIDCLFGVSTKGDWNRWLAFCLRATVAEASSTIDRIDKLLALKTDYESRLKGDRRCSARLQPIVVQLLESPVVTIPDLATKFSVSFPTASKDVDKLVELKIVSPSRRQTKPRYFLAEEILRAIE